MRHYLATLHKKPDHHKRRFALLVSGSVTVLIFTVWALVTFGPQGSWADNSKTSERAHQEVGPLESIRMNVSSSLDSIQYSFEGLKGNVLNSYGQ